MEKWGSSRTKEGEHSAFWHCSKWGRVVAVKWGQFVKMWGGNVWKLGGSAGKGAEKMCGNVVAVPERGRKCVRMRGSGQEGAAERVHLLQQVGAGGVYMVGNRVRKCGASCALLRGLEAMGAA